MTEWKYTEFGQIPAEWDLKTVDEIKSSEKYSMSMGPFGSNITVDNFISEGIPVIRGVNLNFDRFVDGEFVFVSNEKADQLRSSNCKSGDLVFTHRGTIGQVGLIPFKTKYERYIISQSGMKLTVDSRKVDPSFAFYFFKSKYGQFQLLKNESQVGVPSISTPLTSLKEIEIPVPPLIEQQSIASILSSLDDKIDLLHRQNKTLEALAETLFRQWFVEEAEEGWKAGSIKNEFDFTMGQSPPGSSYNEDGTGHIFFQGRTDFGFRFPEPRVYTTEPKRLAKRFDTLVSVRAPVGDMNLALHDCCLGRGVAAFRYKDHPLFTTYTYYKLRSLMAQIKQFEDNGTVFGSIGKDDFKKLENIIPPKELIQTFQSEAAPLDEKILKNTIQILTLTRLRDTLLPKLMSGELRAEMEE